MCNLSVNSLKHKCQLELMANKKDMYLQISTITSEASKLNVG